MSYQGKLMFGVRSVKMKLDEKIWILKWIESFEL